MISLPDVNVLIALAWPNHVHHDAAWEWFEENREQGWATCLLTEAGFVRISCNPTVVKHSVTPLEAIALLRKMTLLGSHSFWSLDRSIANLPQTIGSRLQGYRQITDAILLDAAIQHNGQLATLDGGIVNLVGSRNRDNLHLIPV